MPPEEEKNRIEELKKSLYSRNAPDVKTRRKLRFSDMNSEVRSGWTEPTEEPLEVTQLNNTYDDRSVSMATKILIGSAVFCVLAVGVGLYLFLNGSNLVSGNNIDVVISGPVSIPGGEPVSFGVKVTNNNNADLQLVDMSVAFPAGATDPMNPSQSLSSYELLLGDIAIGHSTSTKVSAIIFGEENMQKTIVATLTYKIKGSSAVFTKVANYDVLINSSPIALTASSFSSITSGQEFDITVALKSNSQDVLKNVLLKADYPFGYTYLSSNIPTLSDKSTWKIGDIPSGAEQKVVIHGKLQGENTDARVFHFTVGARSSANTNVIGTQYGTVTQNVAIEKPFMSLSMDINGESTSADVIGSFGSPQRVTLNWFNNLPVSVTNAVITVNLSGTAYDKLKVQPDLGYFDSANNRIIWNQQTNSDLATISAGDSGSISFSVTPTNTSGTSGNPVVNPALAISANVTADRTQESGVSGSLTSAITRNIKVTSSVSLSGRLVRTVGPFANTGPVPPIAEQKTTYTVVWTISNTTSQVNKAVVTATLPPYVTWMGNVFPANENITYDQNTGTVTWNAGSISPYSTNTALQRREVDFQISFLPSITQLNSSPTLVNQANLTAIDNFTGLNLTAQRDYLTASFSTDPGFRSGDETVVQ